MLRWLHDVSDSCEIWGTEIRFRAGSLGVKQYLSPPFHFATTTTSPHLPFEDRYFGLIYAGSVFTHIDDLADAWFLELRRALRPGGRLFITVHDRGHHRPVPESEGHQDQLAGSILALHARSTEQYCRSEFGMFTIGRSVGVAGVLRRRLPLPEAGAASSEPSRSRWGRMVTRPGSFLNDCKALHATDRDRTH